VTQYTSTRRRTRISRSGSLWELGLLSFIAAYREIFETVLFYRALWAQGDHLPIALAYGPKT